MIGAGQAGLATSYLLTRHGVEHQVLERRDVLGGAWQDRWDSFYLNMLRGLTYDGPAPYPQPAGALLAPKPAARHRVPARPAGRPWQDGP